MPNLALFLRHHFEMPSALAKPRKKQAIRVRNLQTPQRDSPEELETKWSHLEEEIIRILNSQKYENTLEDLYRAAEDLYSQNYEPLFTNIQVVLENFLNEKLEVLKPGGDPEEESILRKINDFWAVFCQNIITIKNIFLFYDRSPKCFKYNTIQNISYFLFCQIIIQNSAIRKQLIAEILAEIQAERNGEDADLDLVKSQIEMLNCLGVYQEVFVLAFLKSSQVYFEEESREKIAAHNVPEYIIYVNQRILREQFLVRNYLNKSSEVPLLEILHKQLIENHIPSILNTGFDQLIDRKMYTELSLVYKLFQRIPGGNKHLMEYFKVFIIKKGVKIIDAQNERNMIQDLLDFKDDLDGMIDRSFENRGEYHECVRGAFKNFMNISNCKSAQLLAKFLDSKLRSKEIADEDLEVILNKAIKLFKYVQGKDIFEAFYKKHLAKRLLLGKSANQDAENSMISKLRDECGSMFTSNIEGMFQDINLSKSINSNFKQKLKNTDEETLQSTFSDFSVNVLTSSYWPNYPNHNVLLPVELVSYQQSFQKFYLSNHSGRKLLWQPSLGHCLVKASFECGYKELQVSLFQAIVLLLFNAAEKIGFREILENTNLEEMELKRTLLSLACGRARVLLKHPKGKDIDEEDVFCFNVKFTDKLYRVKINQIQLQESAEEEKETEKNVLVDRQFQIDAAIVRVMKQKKTIKHSMLVRELYNILDIPVSQSDLKKRIELLIEREYMERDKDNKSHYIYIA